MEQQKWQWKHTRLIVILCDQGVVSNDDYEIEEVGKGNLAFARAGGSPEITLANLWESKLGKKKEVFSCQS